MMHKQATFVGVFDDAAKAERAAQELRTSGVDEKHMRSVGKTAGWDLGHAVPNRKDTPEEMQPDFSGPGISADEASYYKASYEAGYVILIVHADGQRQQIQSILERNGAYNYDNRAPYGDPKATGAMTPGMRGEDSTSPDGVANTAGGEQAARFDEATVEADVEHAENILEQKYQERKAKDLD